MTDAPQADEIDDNEAPLIEHLAELRTRLIHSVLAFIAGMVVCFTVWNPIFDFLTQPLCSAMATRGMENCGLILIKLQEGFFVAVSISLLGGLVLSFPYISFQMWRFVAPGLYKSEQNAFLPFMLASPFMFFLGASFAYYVVTPLAFDFFLGFQQAGTVLDEGEVENATAGIAFQGSAQEYLSLTIKFIVAFGLCFQLPVLLTLMGKAGLVSAEGLRKVRKFAVVGILLLAALVTPPDVITQVILFVVVYGLYEVSIWLVERVEKRREADLRARGLWFEDDDDPYGEGSEQDDPLMREFDETDDEERGR
ncbi:MULTISPECIES: twin-arginine translocase subunit TatC [unclassified Rhodosalinus]|uniref:twin-arginine translocase subunit TatC n=1 Tax=unclassified Rhodosalinus TaxID=2630183 RepID=UPI003524AA2F